MKRLACLFLLALPTTLSAQASCNGSTQIDMNFCARDKWQIADDQLNALWKQVKPKADARGTGKALLTEQRAWLKRRDATCKPELESGGSAAQMFYWSCMEEQTRARNAQLRALR